MNKTPLAVTDITPPKLATANNEPSWIDLSVIIGQRVTNIWPMKHSLYPHAVSDCVRPINKRLVFTARRNARISSAVLATAIPSVCLSVCPSVCHTPVLCQNDGT